MNKRSGLEYLETVLRYVASGSDHIGQEEIRKGIRGVLGKSEENIMPTLAEQWIEQGMQQGIQQGILQASREALIDLLEERFETVVPQTLRSRLKEINDPDLLRTLRKKALRAGSLEAFKDEVEAVLV